MYDKFAFWMYSGEIYRAPRSRAERSYHQLIHWNEVEKGGRFAARRRRFSPRSRAGVAVAVAVRCQTWPTFQAFGSGSVCAQDSRKLLVNCELPGMSS